jgi:hypothetical protein
MAVMVEARRLTEAHRRAQLRIGATTIRQMLAAWGLLDPKDLDRTVARWTRVAIPIVSQQRASSAALAGGYMSAFRALELGPGAFQPTLAGASDRAALLTSLTVTGPATIKLAMSRGVTLERAIGIAQATSAAAAMRHALNGGRGTILASVQADTAALGWARATSGNACAFCEMLASRGPVYGEESADFQAHDNCACTAEPVYDRETEWTPGARAARELWDRTGSLNEFRRALAESRAG